MHSSSTQKYIIYIQIHAYIYNLKKSSACVHNTLKKKKKEGYNSFYELQSQRTIHSLSFLRRFGVLFFPIFPWLFTRANTLPLLFFDAVTMKKKKTGKKFSRVLNRYVLSLFFSPKNLIQSCMVCVAYTKNALLDWVSKRQQCLYWATTIKAKDEREKKGLN